MPITQRGDKWYWGSKGPYNSRKQAEEVQRAAYAAGYGVQQIKKMEMGAPMDGEKRSLTVAELEKKKKQLIKEGDGGGDGFAGTAFTSEGAGIFDPTFGGKGKKKKTGIERLEEFIRDRTPIKLDMNKMESHGTVANGKMGPARIDWSKRTIDEENVQKVTEHEGEYNQDTPAKDAKDKQDTVQRTLAEVEDDEREKDLQLQYGFGQLGGQDDELHRANPKDIISRNPRDDEDEEEEGSNIPEETDLQEEIKSGKMVYKTESGVTWFNNLIKVLE